VANLLLTRLTDRRSELVVRAALGASRARLVQQLTTESVALALAGAGAGLVVAHWAGRLAALGQPPALAAQAYTILDARVLAFAVLLAVLTGITFGVLPALLASRLQPSDQLLRSHAGDTLRAGRLRQSLLAMQVALALVLLTGSVMMSRGFLKLLGMDLGFRKQNLVTLSVSLAGTHIQMAGAQSQYYSMALQRLRAVPGVESAGAVEHLPLAAEAFAGFSFSLGPGGASQGGFVSVASPDYFRTMGARLVYGREFSAGDRAGAEPVAIVNEEFARGLGEPRALVGKKLTESWDKRSFTMVGVARTIRYGPAWAKMPQIFFPYTQQRANFLTFVARVHGRAQDSLAVCRDAVRSADPEAPVFDVKTLEDRWTEALNRPRFYTAVVLVFGGFALLLVLMGIYGIASYSIVQRTHEIGVRLAVGASAGRVRAMLLRQGMAPVAAGVVAGVAGSFAAGRFVRYLIDTPSPGMGIYAAAAGLALAAAAAMWAATRRVLRMDPNEVLRAE
jgi:putative ABC transport system permease protein